jgi:hypothetical protein
MFDLEKILQELRSPRWTTNHVLRELPGELTARERIGYFEFPFTESRRPYINRVWSFNGNELIFTLEVGGIPFGAQRTCRLASVSWNYDSLGVRTKVYSWPTSVRKFAKSVLRESGPTTVTVFERNLKSTEQLIEHLCRLLDNLNCYDVVQLFSDTEKTDVVRSPKLEIPLLFYFKHWLRLEVGGGHELSSFSASSCFIIKWQREFSTLNALFELETCPPLTFQAFVSQAEGRFSVSCLLANTRQLIGEVSWSPQRQQIRRLESVMQSLVKPFFLGNPFDRAASFSCSEFSSDPLTACRELLSSLLAEIESHVLHFRLRSELLTLMFALRNFSPLPFTAKRHSYEQIEQ